MAGALFRRGGVESLSRFYFEDFVACFGMSRLSFYSPRLLGRIFENDLPLLTLRNSFLHVATSCFPIQYPFDFQLEAYTSKDYALKAGRNVTRITDPPPTRPETRNMYARIRPTNTGVLAPWAQRAIALNQTRSQTMRDYGKVEFITILEPLRFGGIPETLLPTIAFLIPLVLVTGFVVFPTIHAYIERVAREAQAELEEKRL